MRITRTASIALAATAIFTAAHGQAQAQAAGGLCPAVRKVVAAADATPTWQGVSRGETGTAVPAGFADCTTSSYSSSADYNCSMPGVNAATVNPRYERLVAELNACLGVTPSVGGDDIATHTRWEMPGDVTVTATRVVQANADNFAVGLGVRKNF